MIKKYFLSFALIALSFQSLAFELTFSRGVPKAHREILKSDMNILKNFTFREVPDAETLRILGVDNLSTPTMVKWLADRVQYVVEERDIEKFKISLSRENFIYPNPGQLPNIDVPPAQLLSDASGGVTIMSNLGTAFYFLGKLSNELLRLRIRTGFLKFEKIDITSPRVGILQIGEGLFMERFAFNRENPKAISNGLNRLTTFFHEARHSDGNGKNLGFFHAICPMDHAFAGQAACDKNLNGPYAVGAQMVKEFSKNCFDCNDSEQEQMKLSFLDSRSRIITETRTPVLTATQQAQLKVLESSMVVLIEKITTSTTEREAEMFFLELMNLNNEREAIMAQAISIDVVNAEFLDPTHEGTRRK